MQTFRQEAPVRRKFIGKEYIRGCRCFKQTTAVMGKQAPMCLWFSVGTENLQNLNTGNSLFVNLQQKCIPKMHTKRENNWNEDKKKQTRKMCQQQQKKRFICYSITR